MSWLTHYQCGWLHVMAQQRIILFIEGVAADEQGVGVENGDQMLRIVLRHYRR